MEEKTNIYTKLFNVKSEGITLQRDTKAFNYKYATLSQIQEKLGEKLQEEKLVVVHSIVDNKVRTEIFDTESEKSVSSEIEMTTDKPQDKGSEITYYRRYNLLSLLDLEVEDDDGKKAQDSKTKKEDKKEDGKPYFNKEELEDFKKVKDNYKTAEEALKVIKSKYRISKVQSDIVSLLYIDSKSKLSEWGEENWGGENA